MKVPAYLNSRHTALFTITNLSFISEAHTPQRNKTKRKPAFWKKASSCVFIDPKISFCILNNPQTQVRPPRRSLQPVRIVRYGHYAASNRDRHMPAARIRRRHSRFPPASLPRRSCPWKHFTDTLFSFASPSPQSFRFSLRRIRDDRASPTRKSRSSAPIRSPAPAWDEELEFYSIKVPDGPLTQHLQKIPARRHRAQCPEIRRHAGARRAEAGQASLHDRHRHRASRPSRA